MEGLLSKKNGNSFAGGPPLATVALFRKGCPKGVREHGGGGLAVPFGAFQVALKVR